jgi:hypothetical protein
LPIDNLYDSIAKCNILPEIFNCRFDADFTNKSKNQSEKIKGILSYNADSLTMQLTSKGINIASVLITTDSILILNKLGKSYIADALSNYDFIERTITLDDIKNILLGRRIDFRDNELFSYTINEYYSLNYRNPNNLFYNIDYNNQFKAEKMKFFSDIGLFYVISYFDFFSVENFVFPTNIDIDLENANCKIKLSRMNFEKKNNLEIKIPDNYQKVEMF